METHYDEFVALQTKPDNSLAGKLVFFSSANVLFHKYTFLVILYPIDMILELCDKLFDIFSAFAESSQKKKAAVWPLLIMLLVITPKSLEEITNAESGAPCGYVLMTFCIRYSCFMHSVLAVINEPG